MLLRFIVLLALALTAIAHATPAPVSSHRRAVEALVEQLAPAYRLDSNLVLAMIEVESGFNPKALSSKNAQGLMQLIPTTAKRFGVRDVWDPEQNLKGGMAYLRWLLDHFDGNVELALAGYNAGEKVVERYRGIPPYWETKHYVQGVLMRVGRRVLMAERKREGKNIQFPPPKNTPPADDAPPDHTSVLWRGTSATREPDGPADHTSLLVAPAQPAPPRRPRGSIIF